MKKKGYVSNSFVTWVKRRNIPVTYKTVVLVPYYDGYKNVLTQDMINEENVKYVIKYDYWLNGEIITVPKNSILEFDGGGLHDGTIIGQDTFINDIGGLGLEKLFAEDIVREGTWRTNGGGSFVQVQSDWNQTNVSKSDYIKNKPTIPEEVTVDTELSETSENPVQNKVITTALKGKQSTLESGKNIKTINGQSLLGEGNIQIEGGGGNSYTKQESDAKYQPKGNYQPAGDYVTGQQLEDKVDKVAGKGLSTNDYTNDDKEKVAAALTEHQDISGKANKAYTLAGYGITDGYTKTEGQALENRVSDRLEAQDNAIELLNGNDVIVVEDHTAVASPDADKIYREPEAVVAPATSPTYYIDWMYYNGQWKEIGKYSFPGIDNDPIPSSPNFINSGGIAKSLQNNFFVGADGTFASTEIYGIIPNSLYRVYFDNTDWVYSGTTSQQYSFSITCVFNGTATLIAFETIGTAIKPYYEFVTPANVDYISIGGRADAGVKVRFLLSYEEGIEKRFQQIRQLHWYKGTPGNIPSTKGVTSEVFLVNGQRTFVIETNRPTSGYYKAKLCFCNDVDKIHQRIQLGEATTLFDTGELVMSNNLLIYRLNDTYYERYKNKACFVGIFEYNDNDEALNLSLFDFDGYTLKVSGGSDADELQWKHFDDTYHPDPWVKGSYISYDGNNKKIVLHSSAIAYQEIKLNSILSNLAVIVRQPYTYGVDYYRIWLFDSEDNLVYSVLPGQEETALVLNKEDIPANATQCYVDVPTAYLDKIQVLYNVENTNLLEYSLRVQNVDLKHDTDYGSIQPNGEVASFNADLVTDFIQVRPGKLTFKVPTFKFSLDGDDYTFVVRIVTMKDKQNAGSTMLYNGKGYDATGADVVVTIPASYNYVRASYYCTIVGTKTQYDGDIIVGLPEGIVASITSGANNNWDIQKKSESDERFKDIEEKLDEGAGVADILLPQFNKEIRHLDGTLDSLSAFVMLHFSDVHSGGDNLERIKKYYVDHRDYITEVLHTGDVVADNWDSDFGFWHQKGADNFLNVIGNHDTAYHSGSSPYDWTRYVGLDAYNRYFAPYIANWGVVQPSNAATLGLCYYYKDYANSNIRMIVLDDMSLQKDGGDAAQITWFEGVLAEALSSGKQVIAVAHYSNAVTPIASSFHCVGAEDMTGGLYVARATLVEKVDAFIANGGTFIAWITGHTHRDIFGKVANTTHSQLNIAVSTAMWTGQSIFDNIRRENGKKSMDLFNVVKIDPYNKRISLFRVGSDYDSDGRHIGTICYDYNGHHLLWNT